ncbi:MAG: trypsin-like peptidase domain-containing protein [Candidatus Poribacteria bacterium]|nr:trypsin-like peptidase domain-containing protein [Candidatus Poribacteria bacterium]
MKKAYQFNLLILLALFFPVFTCSNASLNSANTIGDSAHQPSDIQLLESIENAFVSIVAKSKPGVVTITALNVARKGVHPWSRERKFDRLDGTGFIFRKDGYILTNDHVVNGAKQIKVVLFDGREFRDVQMIGNDPSTDIAVLKVDADNLTPLPLGDSAQVKAGQFAIAIGNPFQLDYTVTTGIVSGTGRSFLPEFGLIRYQDFIQTDAWINKGNSGGPLLNIRGEVIGINSMIRRPDDTPATEAVRAGAGFAIPINLVKRISDQLIANGQVIRGWLGISMREHPQGIRVIAFPDPSPAKRDGIQVGDVIIEYNGQKVEDIRKFRFLIADAPVGEKVKLTVLRLGKQKEIGVTLGKMSPALMGIQIERDSESWRTLGIAVRELGEHDFEHYAYLSPEDQGVIVEEVRLGAPAPAEGVARGTLITAINGQPVRNSIEYEKALERALRESKISFEIKNSYTGEDTETVIVKLKQK